MSLKNLTLKAGALGAVVIFLLISTAVMSIGWIYSAEDSKDIHQVVYDSMKPGAALDRANVSGILAFQEALLGAKSTDPQERKIHVDAAREHRVASEREFETFYELQKVQTPGGQKSKDEGRAAFKQLWAFVDDLGQDPLMVGQLERGTKVQDQTNKYIEEAQGRYLWLMQATLDRSEQRDRDLMIIYASAFAAILVLIATMTRLFFSLLHKPLRAIGRDLETMAMGDLSQTIEPAGTNEIGTLVNSLRQVQQGLASMVRDVHRGIDAMAQGTDSMSQGSIDLSSRTEQQAAALAETASSMQELSSTVSQNAENAREADRLATSASVVAQKGGDIMADVIKTMGSISTNSHKISEIVSVIDNIALQTNILALNAAVEAARAGEQGKGFAVVASEVRSLSQRSAQAAKEIKSLIDQAGFEVDSGSKLVQNAGETMHEIVASVNRVTDIMGEIASASREQASGIDQINAAVSQMDEVTQRNSMLVQETASTAASCKEQLEAVTAAIARLKVAGSSEMRRKGDSAHAVPEQRAPKMMSPVSGQHSDDPHWERF